MKVNVSERRKYIMNELLPFDYFKKSVQSIDKITRVSLITPERFSSLDIIGKYYRWFYILINKNE